MKQLIFHLIYSDSGDEPQTIFVMEVTDEYASMQPWKLILKSSCHLFLYHISTCDVIVGIIIADKD